MSKSDYYLYTRQRKDGKKVYYAKVRTESGFVTFCTDETVKTKANTFAGIKTAEIRAQEKEKAERERIAALQIEAEKNRIPTLKEFSTGFYNYGGEWAKEKIINGGRLSERWCKNKQALLEKYVYPTLGDYPLNEIKRPQIKDLKIKLFDAHYSGNTINKALTALKGILDAALDAELIEAIPKIDRAANNPKTKGILSPEEVKRLFSVEWFDERARIANLTACVTGLRLGELQALTISDFHIDEKYLLVRRSYDNHLHKYNESTKTGKTRIIYIPENLLSQLQYLLSFHPFRDNPETFLFFGDESTTTSKEGIKRTFTDQRPFGHKCIIDGLKKALKKIGINEAERAQRNITFHSWRHFFNSLLINANVPLHKVQSLTGHSASSDMSAHYYRLDDMQDVRRIQESIFDAEIIPDNKGGKDDSLS